MHPPALVCSPRCRRSNWLPNVASVRFAECHRFDGAAKAAIDLEELGTGFCIRGYLRTQFLEVEATLADGGMRAHAAKVRADIAGSLRSERSRSRRFGCATLL